MESKFHEKFQLVDLLQIPSKPFQPLKRLDVSFSPEHLNVLPDQSAQKDKYIGNVDVKRRLLASPSNFLSPHRLNSFRKRRLCDNSDYGYSQDYSFEANQSFPRVRTSFKTLKMDPEQSSSKSKAIMEFVRVDGPNGVRFNSSLAALSESPLPAGPPHYPLTDRLAQGLNPNKAVFTIDSKTTQILIVNGRACSLLGYSSSELCSLRLEQLLRSRPPAGTVLTEGSLNTEDGSMVLMSGKVVEMMTGSGQVMVVSLWIRQLEQDGPCLAVAEPVHFKQSVIFVDGETGLTTGCDSDEAALIFQCEHTDRLVGLRISMLIPSITMPAKDSVDISKQISKQKATGRTFDGTTFPLCLWIKHHDNFESSNLNNQSSSSFLDKEPAHFENKKLYDITVRVYHNVSGLLVVDDSGLVSACNHHFTMLTFGKARGEVVGRPVSSIISNFCHDEHLVQTSQTRSRNVSLSPVHHNHSDSDTELNDDDGSRKSPFSQSIQHSQISQVTRDKSSSALCLDKSSSCQNLDKTHTPTPTQDMVSSISTCEQRMDADFSLLPDVVSNMSNMSMEDDIYNSSISKSRSENILGSENRENNINLANKYNEGNKSTDRSESIYYTSRKSNEFSVNGQPAQTRSKIPDATMRLNFDTSKSSPKVVPIKSVMSVLDKSTMSLDLCDSNETSADFLTPINEMPLSSATDGLTDETDLLSDRSIAYKSMEKPKSDNKNDAFSDNQKGPERDVLVGTPRCVRSSVVCTSTPQGRLGRGVVGIGSAPLHPLHPLHHQPIRGATYRGSVLHKDGTELSIVYTVSSVKLRGGNDVLCVWVSVSNPECVPGISMHPSSINSTADNSVSIVHKQGSHNVSRPLSISLLSQCGEEQTSGEYSKNYVTLKQIGKGAYGCVKMAYRRSDRLLVITKFILKEKVNQQFWVDCPEKSGKKVPLEISLLHTLKHPNIVSVLDVYENDKYFQMIMEKHGSGMDLFEFIERWPKLDEPLTSFIFRQIGQAVQYLHNLNILHRDIKDENVIIDNKFHVKLIDFGSATFRHDNMLFSTFCGTTEYCSPEVLAGNKYAGPELEMWSMGITLYILVFFENPFMDIEDTIQALLVLPQNVSNDLEHLLRWMLCKNPQERCTITQLMAHPWINQAVNITNYNFSSVIECESQELAPETYYSGWGCSGSPLSGEDDAPSLNSHSVSHADHSLPHDNTRTGTAVQQDGGVNKRDLRSVNKDGIKRRSQPQFIPSNADRDLFSDNYSQRSSAEILDISKPISEAGMTDLSSDATGRSACEFECDNEDPYACDSWDECDQESLS